MQKSWFDRPWFFPTVVAVVVASHALDLFGTYVYQPNFEFESNPLYLALKPYGLRLNWPAVIAGKLAVCGLFVLWLSLFLRRRRRYYPEPSANFRELITHYFFGRSLRWVESFYKLPRSLTPTLLALGPIACLESPYFAYLGCANLASKYGWWRFGGFWVSHYWLDHGLLIGGAAAIAGLFWLLWDDFRATAAKTEEP